MKKIDWCEVLWRAKDIFLTLLMVGIGIFMEFFGIYCFKNPLDVINRWKENHAWMYFETEIATQIFGIVASAVGCFFIVVGIIEFFMACRDEL